MPNGLTHDKITILVAIAAIPIGMQMLPAEPESLNKLAVGITAHILSGMACSPDMDTDSISFHRWGILRFLWIPYQKIVPHRSWISHGWIIAPTIRLAYLGALLYALVCLLALQSERWVGWWVAVQQWQYWVWFIGGWFLGSISHSIADQEFAL